MKELIEDGRAMRVPCAGSWSLKMHSNTDFHVKLREVYVTDGIGFNLISLHGAQAR